MGYPSFASLTAAVVSFLVVWLATPKFIAYFNKIQLVVKDMHKEGKPLIPISGGVSVVIGVTLGLLTYISIRTFFFEDVYPIVDIFAVLTSILLVSLVGFMDDLVIKKSKDYSVGLNQWQKPLLTVVAAIPFMVINAGVNTIAIPFFGRVDIGLLYPLVLIPIGVVGASNMVNMLGGFNGLETGLGIIYFGMLGLYAFVNVIYAAALICLVTFTALLAFYRYNKSPAKILPGDSLTYLMGALLASVAIVGNMEKAALIVSIPFFVEFFLKLRGRFKLQSYGYVKEDKVCSMYNKIYSIPHIFTRKCKYTEKQVVYFVLLIQLLFSSLIWFV